MGDLEKKTSEDKQQTVKCENKTDKKRKLHTKKKKS